MNILLSYSATQLLSAPRFNFGDWVSLYINFTPLLSCSTTKAEQNEAFRVRTKAAALRIIRLYQQLPRSGEAEVLGKQLLRSATSVAANYRAACRGRSAAEFFAKLSVCVEEADEVQLWLELLGEAAIIPKSRLAELEKEYAEIVAILTKARKTASIE